MVRVTAGELQKQFGTYSEAAQREPVTITKHGRDSLVLVSSETFEKMSQVYFAPKHYYSSELPDDVVEEIERQVRELEAELAQEDASK
jgi:prevent-host-death family protein